MRRRTVVVCPAAASTPVVDETGPVGQIDRVGENCGRLELTRQRWHTGSLILGATTKHPKCGLQELGQRRNAGEACRNVPVRTDQYPADLRLRIQRCEGLTPKFLDPKRDPLSLSTIRESGPLGGISPTTTIASHPTRSRVDCLGRSHVCGSLFPGSTRKGGSL